MDRAGVGACEDRLPRLLGVVGVHASLLRLAKGEPVGQALLETVRELGANLLVMGAYAHGPWREALLGGVTRDVLMQATLPVLLQG